MEDDKHPQRAQPNCVRTARTNARLETRCNGIHHTTTQREQDLRACSLQADIDRRDSDALPKFIQRRFAHGIRKKGCSKLKLANSGSFWRRLASCISCKVRLAGQEALSRKPARERTRVNRLHSLHLYPRRVFIWSGHRCAPARSDGRRPQSCPNASAAGLQLHAVTSCATYECYRPPTCARRVASQPGPTFPRNRPLLTQLPCCGVTETLCDCAERGHHNVLRCRCRC